MVKAYDGEHARVCSPSYAFTRGKRGVAAWTCAVPGRLRNSRSAARMKPLGAPKMREPVVHPTDDIEHPIARVLVTGALNRTRWRKR
eukprot:CAMPEP_0195615702 /NCGR_PEP_ID=MMETSP0815-20121206/12624_1 /TAXON_ID=97485 /ORGANISM="Prymnesium parvum, Strain Texoma1" /LENGTH=86 /DNA_ID=CAMNT_0040756057 /DNA_START=602 /DNA_END=859 /DNA_ORIENTATION=-